MTSYCAVFCDTLCCLDVYCIVMCCYFIYFDTLFYDTWITL